LARAASDTVTLKQSAGRNRAGRLFCLLALLFALGGLVAGRLGALWIHFDVFTQLSLHFCALAVAGIIGFLMPRARVLSVTVLMIAAILAIGIWPHKVSETPKSLGALAPGEIGVRLATFNTWSSNADADAVAAAIESLDPDIATLMEFGPEKSRALEQLRLRYPYQYSCIGIDYCYMAIVSKEPFAGAPEARGGDWQGPAYVLARFGPEVGNLTVLGAHTLRFPHQRAQFRQIAELAKIVQSQTRPMIVMGDFNATPFSRQLATFEQSTGLKRLTWLPTWPALLNLPQLAIDHVFVSGSIRQLEEERIGDHAGSDHHPVTLLVAVPGN
jgi:endonuclease/exonuclease/phosphatase (EEP) superfamily protein YafD